MKVILTRHFPSAIFVVFCIFFAQTSGVTKKHEGKPRTHEGKTNARPHHKGSTHHGEHKSGNAVTHKHGNIAGTRSHLTHESSTHTTTNYIQWKIRNRWRFANKTTKDYWFSNESISLDSSFSYEPLEWSDNRLPPTLRPIDEHVQMWKDLMKEVTYPDTSNPEITLDPDESQLRYYQCLFCFNKYDTDVKLDHHYHKHHPDKWVISTTTEKIFRCAICLDKFPQSAFRAHQETVHNFTGQRYPFEQTVTMNYDSFDTKEAQQIFDKRFGGSDEYKYETYPKNNTFFMTIYDFDSNFSGPITNHYIDPWPDQAND